MTIYACTTIDRHKHTQLLVFFNGFLLSHLETLGLGGSKIIVVVGHGVQL